MLIPKVFIQIQKRQAKRRGTLTFKSLGTYLVQERAKSGLYPLVKTFDNFALLKPLFLINSIQMFNDEKPPQKTSASFTNN